jgi:hypothetical protein
MGDPAFSFVVDGDDGFAIVVNFALYAGREATRAELDRLADTLLERVSALELVSEQRVEVDRGGRASVYLVRVELPAEAAAERAELTELVERWARDCIAERSVLTP